MNQIRSSRIVNSRRLRKTVPRCLRNLRKRILRKRIQTNRASLKMEASKKKVTRRTVHQIKRTCLTRRNVTSLAREGTLLKKVSQDRAQMATNLIQRILRMRRREQTTLLLRKKRETRRSHPRRIRKKESKPENKIRRLMETAPRTPRRRTGLEVHRKTLRRLKMTKR